MEGKEAEREHQTRVEPGIWGPSGERYHDAAARNHSQHPDPEKEAFQLLSMRGASPWILAALLSSWACGAGGSAGGGCSAAPLLLSPLSVARAGGSSALPPRALGKAAGKAPVGLRSTLNDCKDVMVYVLQQGRRQVGAGGGTAAAGRWRQVRQRGCCTADTPASHLGLPTCACDRPARCQAREDPAHRGGWRASYPLGCSPTGS